MLSGLELRAHRIEAINEIENLMSRHTYYHAACKNREELLELWSQSRKEEVVWSQNMGRWIGMDKLMKLYAGDDKYTAAAALKERVAKVRPELAEKIRDIDGRQMMEMPTHALASGVIEVAEDGMSAKGVWYTPGFALRHNYATAESSVIWMWEKYGADFVYEEGGWKFLRLLICMDMSGDDKNDWTKPKKFKGPPPEAAGLLPDEPGRFAEYTPTRPNLEIPKLPEPYKTEKDTFKY